MNRRDVLKQFAAGCALAPFANLALAKDAYSELNPAQPTDDPGKIEVLEFFHYGCPHCRDLDPLIEVWKKQLPADVSFRRVPAIWNNAQLTALARLYFAAQTAGELDSIHGKVFGAIQDEKRSLFSETDVAAWLRGKVEDPAKVINAYKSFGVNSMIQRADQLGRAMKVNGVPTLVIEGRFVTSASMAGSHEQSLKVADQLIERVRKERAGK